VTAAARTAALLGAALTASLGCVGVKSMNATGGGGRDGGSLDAPTGTGGRTATGGGGSTGTGGTGGACTPVSCTQPGGQYCGMIGNGCNDAQECGACPGDGTCSGDHICLGGPSCMPATCDGAGGGARYCGDIGDGCGHSLPCGDCPAGQTCKGNVCVVAGCVALTCGTAGPGQYCGMIGDGCGTTIDCGGCPAGFTCGGGGLKGVCGAMPPDCTPVPCTQTAGQYCGEIGNGCGGIEDCGACANGMACGTSGLSAHICPGSKTGCVGLECQIDKCEGGAPTSISGVVFDPAGKNALYNVVLYVPNAALDPIASGVSCDRCDSPISGQPVAATLSDSKGHFQMDNVPSGTNIPLVIQVGKWRRQITLPEVKPCQDNPFNDPNTFRLPRNQSEGHLPLIALSTGHADALDCLLRKIGISDSEFTNDAGGGRVHMYVGGAGKTGDQGAAKLASGAVFGDSYGTLFPNYTKMAGYDILLLQCESEQLASNKDPYAVNMKKYADRGGRVFAEHLHSYWIRKGLPPWPATGLWTPSVQPDLVSPITAFVDTTFAKGAALSDWLVAVGASTTPGQIPIVMGQHSIDGVAATTQQWIHTTTPTATTQYLTFNTPVEAAAPNQCGRVTFTDVHVATGGDSSHPDVGFPLGCTGPLDMTPQEKALEFMFFDLSSCVQIGNGQPQLPPPGGTTAPPGATQMPPAPPPPPPPPPPPVIP
jgi:hypothetical protein